MEIFKQDLITRRMRFLSATGSELKSRPLSIQAI